ncbi:MAG: PAC2 family protein [Dehalococcoidia bacterium]|nr:PAC2 family protein [Dehalococcoidia bacterium]MDD5493271.1 PAC2 family protein [Dehalococcoidia bacterium]
MELGKIIFFQQPPLRRPDLIAAFIGWPDAAQVSTGTLSYLISTLAAKKFAEIKSDEFYDFATVRPTVSIEKGLMTPLRLPVNSFYYWHNQNGEHDLIILTGIEPQMKWQTYVEAVADLAGLYNVNRVYAIGGLFDRIPHTRKTRISGLVNETGLLEMFKKFTIEPINYQGPSSVHGLLLTICAMRRIPAVSIWGHVPFYIRADTNPIVCLEMVKKVSAVLDIAVNLDELNKAADNLYAMLNTLLGENEQMRTFLKTLEEQYDIEGSNLGGSLEGADKIIKDIEDFLKSQRRDE